MNYTKIPQNLEYLNYEMIIQSLPTTYQNIPLVSQNLLNLLSIFQIESLRRKDLQMKAVVLKSIFNLNKKQLLRLRWFQVFSPNHQIVQP